MLAQRSNRLSYTDLQITLFWVLVFGNNRQKKIASKLSAIEMIELSILSLLAWRSNRLNYMALHITQLIFGLCTITNLTWIHKMLAIERLQLKILAMLARRSNRLHYGVFFLTIDCSYWKDYSQPNCSAYSNKFKMASRTIAHREPRTLDLSNVNRTL